MDGRYQLFAVNEHQRRSWMPLVLLMAAATLVAWATHRHSATLASPSAVLEVLPNDSVCNGSFPAHAQQCGRCWLCPVCSWPPRELTPQCSQGQYELMQNGAPLPPGKPPCCALCATFCAQASVSLVEWAHSNNLIGGDGRDTSRSLCATMALACP